MNDKLFIKVPNVDLQGTGLEMKDLVVYAYLKKHYNHVTKESFPSFSTLVSESTLSKPTLMKSVARLEQAGYISIRKDQKVNHYTFSETNKFEIYSFDFLDDPSLSVNDKAYMICMQPHMFKSNSGLGKVTYSELDLAQMLNIDIRTLRKYESHLQQGDKPIMSLVPTKKIDPVTGLAINERIYDFEAYNNLLAIKFNQIDTSISDTNRELSSAIDKIAMLEKRIKEMEKITKSTEVQPITL